MHPVVYFVGDAHEVAHHAAPLLDHFQRDDEVRLQVAPSDSVVQQAQPGDLAIFYSEHFDRFRHTCQQLKQRQVATLYMIDGILEWRNAWDNRPDELASPFAMRPALADKVACIGNSQARVLESWGNAGKTEVVGIPRLAAALASYREAAFAQQTTPRPSDPTAPLRILAATAKTPAFTAAQWASVRQSLQDLKAWSQQHLQLGSRPIEWTWRLTSDLDRELDVTNSLGDLTGVELSQTLRQVDLVITTPSTVMLEAMLIDLPVALLDYHNCPHYVQTGWDISAATQIGLAIESMAQRPEARMLFQRNQLYDALHVESDSVSRMAELIRKMLRSASQQIDAGKTSLEFPLHVLVPPSQLSAEFCHQRLFPTVQSFQSHDLAALQAEHANARREIDHLHAEIQQLKSELDQAHQIFDAIHRHPIAGPVVRLRETVLGMMARMTGRSPRAETTRPSSTAKPASDFAATTSTSGRAESGNAIHTSSSIDSTSP